VGSQSLLSLILLYDITAPPLIFFSPFHFMFRPNPCTGRARTPRTAPLQRASKPSGLRPTLPQHALLPARLVVAAVPRAACVFPRVHHQERRRPCTTTSHLLQPAPPSRTHTSTPAPYPPRS
jgi:hypothetical protein